jgi:hypothetical protein
MSDTSPRLALPYLQPAQAQKHVTHNEALRVLDVVVQLAVVAFGATVPPTLPEEGKVYALGVGATGAWFDEDGKLAVWVDAGWQFHVPEPGWIATLAGGRELRVWTGSGWQAVAAATQNLDGIGVNTASDSYNRLAVAAPASLLSHEGAGHQLKINKASSGDTASLLYQSNWSGRAEMGLAGDDAFSIKVSADGSSWDEALRITPGTQVFHTGNAVGPVSATPGIGSGIVETGTNANGSFTKFADGTMICIAPGFASASGAAATWTFPAAFASGSVSVTATARGTSAAIVTVDAVSASAADIHTFDTSGADTIAPTVDLVAVGRCF